MSNRCANCQKFVSLENGEPELVEEGFDPSDGVVTASVRLVRICAECGEEVKQASVDGFAETPKEILNTHRSDGHKLSCEFGEPESTERVGLTDRHGKPVTNPRYATSFYGASVPFSIRCSCQQMIPGPDGTPVQPEPLYDGSIEVEEQASGFDDLG